MDNPRIDDCGWSMPSCSAVAHDSLSITVNNGSILSVPNTVRQVMPRSFGLYAGVYQTGTTSLVHHGVRRRAAVRQNQTAVGRCTAGLCKFVRIDVGIDGVQQVYRTVYGGCTAGSGLYGRQYGRCTAGSTAGVRDSVRIEAAGYGTLRCEPRMARLIYRVL